MALTVDQNLKLIIGDLVVSLAKLTTDNEILKEQVPAPNPLKPQEPPKP